MTIDPSVSPDHKLLAAIIDSLPVPTIGINPAGVIMAWNRAMETIVPVKAEEMLGKGNYEHGLRIYGFRRPLLLDLVLSPDDEIRKWYPSFQRGVNQLIAEIEVKTPENRIRYFRNTAAAILDSNSEPLGFIQSITDLTKYKETENELIQQRESITTVLEHTPVGTAIVDAAGKITYMNQRTIDITGFTVEEIPTSEAWFGLAYPDEEYRKKLLDNWNRQLSETGEARGTARIVNKEGQVKYLDFQAVRLWDGRVINSIWDLTPQKMIEEELRASEEKFKALSEASLEGILFLENGYCVEASKKGADMLGYEYDEIIGIPTRELVAPESWPLVDKNVYSSYELPYEITALRKDGTRLPLEVQGRTFFYLGRKVRATVLNDLSERKRAQEQIEIQNRNLSTLFSGSPDGLVFGDLDQVIIDVNPRFTEIFGFEKQECVGKRLADLVVPDEFIAEYDSNFSKAKLTDSVTMETVRKNKYGEKIDVLVNVVPVPKFGCYVMYTDIRERKLAEKVIQRQLQELETKNAEMERFTYTVSHDLRSPLITIQGFSTLLLEDIKNGEYKRLESDLTRVINAASKMDQLLQDLLELSRIGRMLNPLSVFSMSTLVDEVIELLNGPITNRGVKVVIDSGFPMVNADRSRIQEVLQNLIENAIKFMGDQNDPEIRIGYLPGKEENIFFVRDNGMGIESVYLEKIFGLFEQLDAANEGTGIGLALVKRIIEFHEGRIWVESEGLGKGSSFFFTLPKTTN